MKNRIIRLSDSPRDLEALYRANSEEFTCAFPNAHAELPDSPIMQAWKERLFFDGEAQDRDSGSRLFIRYILLTVFLSLVAGTMAKMPHFFPSLDEEIFYTRNLGGIIAGALIVYFCIQNSCRTKISGIILTLALGAILYLNLLPDQPNSQTIVLSCLHMLFFFWSLVGIAYLRGAFRELKGRMNFIRYNGELLIYTTVIVIGGIVLTGLTFALFDVIGLDIEEWYLKNVVIYGAIASPIVATLLVERVVNRHSKIAPLLAKIFVPLFLLTVITYLFAMVASGRSPFTDRDFLIAFNALLFVVLGLSVFSISERGIKRSAGVVDIMNIGLTAVTLMIDIVALAAILYRLTSYGFSPNRLAMLGANLLIFCHLAGILFHYLRFARTSGPFEKIEDWIVRYISAYTSWSLFVAVGFPLIFWFE